MNISKKQVPSHTWAGILMPACLQQADWYQQDRLLPEESDIFECVQQHAKIVYKSIEFCFSLQGKR